MYVPTNPKNKKRPFSCPECQGVIRLHTDSISTRIDNIDAETGQEDGFYDSTSGEPTDEQWVCHGPKGEGGDCDWRGNVESYDGSAYREGGNNA